LSTIVTARARALQRLQTPQQPGAVPVEETSVTADKATNSLVITASPQEFKDLEEIIQKQDWQNADPSSWISQARDFAKRRHDAEQQVVLALEHDLTSALALTFDFVGVINHSNIDNFQYDRNIVSIGVRVLF
jgi:hypothetical protein